MENVSVDKTVAKKTATKKTDNVEVKVTKVALFAPNSIYYQPLGRLNKGYTIVDSNVADEWYKISDKVREASPNEVASAFEV